MSDRAKTAIKKRLEVMSKEEILRLKEALELEKERRKNKKKK